MTTTSATTTATFRTDEAGSGMIPLVQAAALLGLAGGTLRQRVTRGTVKPIRYDGKWYFTPEGIEAIRNQPAPRRGWPVRTKKS